MTDWDDRLSRRLKELGERVRMFRRAEGMSQEELAERTGLHRTYVGSVERGERNVSIKNLWALADSLGISVATLIGDK